MYLTEQGNRYIEEQIPDNWEKSVRFTDNEVAFAGEAIIESNSEHLDVTIRLLGHSNKKHIEGIGENQTLWSVTSQTKINDVGFHVRDEHHSSFSDALTDFKQQIKLYEALMGSKFAEELGEIEQGITRATNMVDEDNSHQDESVTEEDSTSSTIESVFERFS